MGKARAKRQERADTALGKCWLQELVPEGNRLVGGGATSREVVWTDTTLTSPLFDDAEKGPTEVVTGRLQGETPKQVYRRHCDTIVELVTAAGTRVVHRDTLTVEKILRRRATEQAAREAAIRKQNRRRASEAMLPFRTYAAVADEGELEPVGEPVTA